MNLIRNITISASNFNCNRLSIKALQTVTKRYASYDMVDPPEDMYVIPCPKSRENESLKNRKARLLYQSRKRGMLENDLLLSTFAAKYLDNFTHDQVELYDSLINGPSNDWDIYYWATGIKPVPDGYNNHIMDLLRTHCKNLNKEPRIRQPDLA